MEKLTKEQVETLKKSMVKSLKSKWKIRFAI